MLIRQLFSPDRDPTRHLNEVVNAEERIDPRSEIDEYVFTDHTREYLRSLIDGILDTAQGVMPDCLRCWIAGFFGSGKSHFLKLAAALLENRLLELPGTGNLARPALEYAVSRHQLDLSWERIAKDFRIRAVTVNLAMAHGGGRQAQEKPLLYRLASEINRAWGYSAVPHVAVIEREIRRAKKWDAFLKAVRDYNESVGEIDSDGRPYEWTHGDIRDMASDAHRVLELVLPGVLPKYQKPREYLADLEAEQPTPEAVLGLAVDFATSLHADLGRVLLCVDEVALYLKGAVGFDADRVREVQGLAETVKNKGRGKVFLLATAQLRVDTIDSAFAALSDYVVFLRDRFPKGGRLELEERDIDTVVRERWLKKDPGSPDYATLERLVRDHGGLLARAAKLRDESLIRDTDGLTDPNAVMAYYPCLPYHIRLLQSILEALRGEKQIDQSAAQSRALLTAVRSLFVPQNGAHVADAEVGTLVTFDRVYDVIRDVVRKADSGTDRWITETIEGLANCGAVRISSVAKTVFLLQHLNPQGQRRVRVSAENVAALLYPRLGMAWEPHLKDVRDACQKLLDEHFIGEEPDAGYRFYRPEEKTFQKEVDDQPIDESKVHESLKARIAEEAKALGMRTFALPNGHRLDIDLTVHVGAAALPDPSAKPRGLDLHLIWPRLDAPPQQVRLWAARYSGASHVLLWALAGGVEAEELARKALKLEVAIGEYSKRHGLHAVDFLRGEQTKLERLRDELLPQAVRKAIESGATIHAGVDTVLAGTGKKPQDAFRDMAKQAVGRVFTQLDDGCAIIDEAGLRKVLTWKAPQSPPDYFATLKLFDASGQPLVDRPFLKEIVLALQGRPENERTGRAVLAHFAEAPYGWPERAVKVGLAALVRGRRVTVKLPEGGTIRSESDPKAESWLTGTQQFNRSVLELSDLVVTAEERELLQRLFAQVFQRPGLDTIEKLEREGPKTLQEHLAQAREALADLRGRRLPGVDHADALVRLLGAATEPDHPAGVLKQLAAQARKAAEPHGDPVDVLGTWSRTVAAVVKLRAQGKLDMLAGARSRALSLYAPWRSAGHGDVVAADLVALTEQATSDTLLTQADSALERDCRIFAAYGVHYRLAHGVRHQRAADGLATIESHPAWSSADASLQDRLRRSMAELDCSDPADLALPAAADGRCPSCRTAFMEIGNLTELVAARLATALRQLDALIEPPPLPPPTTVPEVTVELRSGDDLPLLFGRIEEVAKTALTRPRLVRVVFEEPRP